ncbi:PPA1309 family protein [Actinokineospora enzanensis]|uniref:PPA1309 family protein n=1 Tax=Actinokineospora enzanensis TaxID=155975 RepID=UPI0003737141|nr:PPA1309 family protein [Actinokineospora enzanensis]
MAPVSDPTVPDLPAVTREVEEFVAAGGWDQPPQLFALVPTAHLLAERPELADQLDPASTLTPIAQEPLPDGDLGAALATIMWPEVVAGCALTQEIVMLPPEAEAELPDGDTDTLGRVAASHPQAREARLVAAALRDGTVACVLRLRTPDPEVDEIVEHPGLADNLTTALYDTLRA